MSPTALDAIRDAYFSWETGQHITNSVFKLHYVASFLLLTLFLASTTVQLFQESYVTCVGPDGDAELNIDRFAYYLSTFTLVTESEGNQETTVKHNYYLWVPLLFLYQMIVFRWTFRVWQNSGGGVLRTLQDENVQSQKKFLKLMKRYVVKRMGAELNYLWLFKLLWVEFLNIMVCLHHWLTTDYILNGNFLGLSYENRFKVFPLETKFTFRTYGPTGTVQVKDYLCVLGLNALYREIFFYYWYWLLMLTIFSIFIFVYHVVLPLFYLRICSWQTQVTGRIYPWNKDDRKWMKALQYPDWLFLQYLRHPLDMFQYEALLEYLAKKHSNPDESSPSGSENEEEAENEDDDADTCSRTLIDMEQSGDRDTINEQEMAIEHSEDTNCETNGIQTTQVELNFRQMSARYQAS